MINILTFSFLQSFLPDNIKQFKSTPYGGKGRQIRWVSVSETAWRDPGGATLPQDIQCGGGYIPSALGLCGGVGVWRIRPRGFFRDVQRMVAQLYANYRLLAYMRQERLQWVFNVLTELFYQVNLRTNVGKMVCMEFQPCHAIGGHMDDG